MRTRQKARLEAELAAAAAANKDQEPPELETQPKDKAISLPSPPEQSPEPSEEISEESGHSTEHSESSESAEEEEEVEEISDSFSNDNEEQETKRTEQEGPVDNGVSEDLLLLDSKSTGSTLTSSLSLLPAVTGRFASSLQPDIEEEMYFDFDSVMMGGAGSTRGTTIDRRDDPDKELMKRSVLPPDLEKRETAPLIYQSKLARQKLKKSEHKKSAGASWFDMPATEITPELKNDLKLLRMRNALDPSRHYKANDSKQLPRYFQVGRVVGGPTDFYSGRIPRRQQKQTLVDELLANEDFRKYHKKKYVELQNKFTSGTKRLKNIKHRKKYKK